MTPEDPAIIEIRRARLRVRQQAPLAARIAGGILGALLFLVLLYAAAVVIEEALP